MARCPTTARPARCRRTLVSALVAALALGASGGALADPAIPDPGYFQAPADASAAHAKQLYIFGEPAPFQGTLTWRYNDAGRPASLSLDTVIGGINAATQQWMNVCRVNIVRGADTTSPPQDADGNNTSNGQNVLGWGNLSLGANGNPAIAGVTWSYSNGSGDLVAMDMTYSPSNVTTTRDLALVAVHEWGHAIGLAHSNVPATVMSGPGGPSNPGVPATGYTGIGTLTDDDRQGCLCLYGPSDAMAGQGFLCGLPTVLPMGTVPVGSDSAPALVTLRNASSSATLTIASLQFTSTEMRNTGACGNGTVIAPGGSCTVSAVFHPQGSSGTRTTSYLMVTTVNGVGTYTVPITARASPAATGGSGTSAVVEFYNAGLDHYFITADAGEVAVLDAGTIKGWARTGAVFRTYLAAAPATSPVCRYYIPPAQGNSHFFSVFPSECNVIPRSFPTFVFEGANVMYMYLPEVATGACPVGSTPVYRVWNQRPDTNHRYMIDLATRDRMVAKGYVAEGYGPDGVAMCAPL